MPVGRPLKFQSVEELQEKIDDYFRECDPHWIDVEILVYPKKSVAVGKKMMLEDDYDQDPEIKLVRRMSKQIPYTITGLALSLGTTRETLLEYEGEVEGREKSKEYADTIKAAKLKCQNYTELSLYGTAPTGPIFSLKNNYGWKDKTEVDSTNTHNIKFEDMTDEQLERAIEERKNRVA
ncbi:MAG TPA: terminase small subunit [Candidatus Saccharimonadales bacterium]|nr:terminase small subunit [Candidatus Saccharimonadales bacterium]